ncbi:hypothetical protein BGZ60DRAFT_407241, partial [Tricladium varicosporioides]
TSAPFSRSNLTISTCPLSDAEFRGVHPLSFSAVMSAPFSRSSLTTSIFPLSDAEFRGVHPS